MVTNQDETYPRVGIPKGRRFKAPLNELFSNLSNLPRTHELANNVLLGKFRFFYLRTPDIARLLSEQQLDFGFIGSEWVKEQNITPIRATPVGWYNASVCLIGPVTDTTLPKNGAKVLTEFPRITNHHLDKYNLFWTPQPVSGSVESAVPHFADYGVTVVETGRTLRDNGLVVLRTIAPAVAQLVQVTPQPTKYWDEVTANLEVSQRCSTPD